MLINSFENTHKARNVALILRVVTAGYHWDCSDWARHSQTPLADITEVPGSEIPDSSSFHSNESNESRSHHGLHSMPAHVDRSGIQTLREDLEYIADSECEQHLAGSSLNALDSGNEEYRFSTGGHLFRFDFCFSSIFLLLQVSFVFESLSNKISRRFKYMYFKKSLINFYIYKCVGDEEKNTIMKNKKQKDKEQYVPKLLNFYLSYYIIGKYPK